jgi:hypothetical protein
VGGQNAWKEMVVFVFMFKNLIVELNFQNCSGVFFKATTGAVGRECAEKVLGKVRARSGGWAG